jgi:hypothetical protein
MDSCVRAVERQLAVVLESYHWGSHEQETDLRVSVRDEQGIESSEYILRSSVPGNKHLPGSCGFLGFVLVLVEKATVDQIPNNGQTAAAADRLENQTVVRLQECLADWHTCDLNSYHPHASFPASTSNHPQGLRHPLDPRTRRHYLIPCSTRADTDHLRNISWDLRPYQGYP